MTHQQAAISNQDLSPSAQTLIAQSQDHTRKTVEARGTQWSEPLDNLAHYAARVANDKNWPEINLYAVNGTEVNIGYKNGFEIGKASFNSIEAATTDKSESLAAMHARDHDRKHSQSVTNDAPVVAQSLEQSRSRSV